MSKERILEALELYTKYVDSNHAVEAINQLLIEAKIEAIQSINLRRYGDNDGTGSNPAIPLGNWIGIEVKRLQSLKDKEE